MRKRLKQVKDAVQNQVPKGIQSAVQSELDQQFKEKPVILAHLAKWLLLATLVGIFAGALSALFLYVLNSSITIADAPTALFLVLPISLVANVLFIYYVFPNEGQPSTNQAITQIYHKTPISMKTAVKAFFGSIITIAGGGSAGKEAPAADMGAAAGSTLGGILRFDPEDRRKLAICGISAGFAAVFGTPIAGALFGLEVLFVGGLLYQVLLPAFVAGIVGYTVAGALGAPFWYHSIPVAPGFSEVFFLKVILAGIFFGLCALAMIYTLKISRVIFKGSLKRKLALALAAGLIMATLASVVSTKYMGLGIDTIEASVEGQTMSGADAAWKTVFTGLTFAGGGTGGLVTPILFVGSTAGNFFAQIFNGDLSTFAAIGAVAVLAGAANTPIAASVLAIELFGPEIAPYAAIAAILAFSITGHKSVYPSQIYATQKVPANVSFGARWNRLKQRLFRRKDNKDAEKKEYKGKL